MYLGSSPLRIHFIEPPLLPHTVVLFHSRSHRSQYRLAMLRQGSGVTPSHSTSPSHGVEHRHDVVRHGASSQQHEGHLPATHRADRGPQPSRWPPAAHRPSNPSPCARIDRWPRPLAAMERSPSLPRQRPPDGQAWELIAGSSVKTHPTEKSSNPLNGPCTARHGTARGRCVGFPGISPRRRTSGAWTRYRHLRWHEPGHLVPERSGVCFQAVERAHGRRALLSGSRGFFPVPSATSPQPLQSGGPSL